MGILYAHDNNNEMAGALKLNDDEKMAPSMGIYSINNYIG